MTEQTQRPAATPRPNRAARRLGKIAAGLTALPFVWLLANRIDAQPSPAAAALMTPAAAVADADNAWLFYIGIDAGTDADPAALGRSRVDGFNARAAQVPMPPPTPPDDAAQDAYEWQEWPALMALADCPHAVVDCLEWLPPRAAELQQQAQIHALPLQRLPALYQLPRWQVAYTPSRRSPETSTYLFDLARDLQALALAQALQAGDQAALAGTVAQMALAADFWRRVAAPPQDDQQSLTDAANALIGLQRLAARLQDRLDAVQAAALAEPLQRIYALPAPVDWAPVQRRNFQQLAHNWRDTTPGPLAALRSCLDGRRQYCYGLKDNWFYAPQATLNRAAAFEAELLAGMNTPPPEAAALLAGHKALVEARKADADTVTGVLGRLLYNFHGKYKVDLFPGVDLSRAHGDKLGVMRLLALRHQALAQNLAAEDMPAFLARQPAALRNPHSGQAFDWNAARQEMSFVPHSIFWLRPAASVNWPPLPAPGAHACPAPLVVELSDTDEDLRRRVNRFASCGLGNRAFELAVDDSPSGRGSYDALRLLRVGAAYDIRALQVEDGDYALYERLGAALDGSEDVWLRQPTARDDSRDDESVQRVLLTVHADKSAPALVSVNAASLPARALLAQIGDVAGLRIDGLALAGDTRVQLQGDMPAEAALRAVAAQAGLAVEAGAQGFVLSAPAPP